VGIKNLNILINNKLRYLFAVWTGLLSRFYSKAAQLVALQINRPSPTALAGSFSISSPSKARFLAPK
jgi:hypothetical protein